MAAIVLGGIGSTLGASLGGTLLGVSAMTIGGGIGSMIGSAIDSRIIASFTPDQRQEGARLDELRVTSATEGAVIPRIYGRMRVGGNMIWATDFREEYTETRQSGSGKGGGGGVPRCVPVDIKRNRHGDRAVSVIVGTERILVKGKWRTIDIRACPVTWRPHPEQIASARRGYEDWWAALDWVRDGLNSGQMLSEIAVTNAMPKTNPWVQS
jgi:hypothetical protein